VSVCAGSKESRVVDETKPQVARPLAARPIAAEPAARLAGRRPWWAIAGLTAIAVLALVLYTWALSRNGMGNSYYAAAIRSGAVSWKAFFFGSLDPGSFITVDKLPAGLWVPALFARLFGFSSWSILLPQALAGVASVLILHRLVRRWAGNVAALLAALAFALTPVAVMMFRFNNPDAFLTLLLLLAAWAVWSAAESGSTWRLAAAGALVGFAFLTKMLEAFVVLPALILVYLVCGPFRLGRRLLQLGLALVSMVVCGGWWVAIVEWWPPATRPYVGGSVDNSVLSLVFSRSGGYLGNAGPVPNFSGGPGWLRMFNVQLGGQISWLIPLALVGLAAGLWVTRRVGRTDRARAGSLLWGLWSLVIIAVFSHARGVLHPYYTVLLAPGIAALAGAGSVDLWRLSRSRRWLAWLLPAAVVGTAVWSAALLKRTPGYAPGLATTIIVVGAVAAIALVLVLARLVKWPTVVCGVATVAAAVVLAGPFAYAISTVSRSVAGPLAAAGPAVAGGLPGMLGSGAAGAGNPGGFGLPGGPRMPAGAGLPGGSGAEDLTVDQALLAYLQQHRAGAKYLVAVQGSSAAVPLILAAGEPVMAMGGFNGSDPAPTAAQLERMVAEGQIHYVLLGGLWGMLSGLPPGQLPDGPTGRPGAPGGGPAGAPGGVARWVVAHGTVVPAVDYGGMSMGGTLYYLR
jgi:4-amino-4-deoxy-L-arabinose transferase-like glycosyltransferase